VEAVEVAVGTAYDDGVFTLGFETDDGAALLLSLSDQVDEQDSLLGIDSYAISTADGATVYGGVESANLSGVDLSLHLSERASEALGLPRDPVLRLRDASEADAAREGFRRVGVSVGSV
jgi:hypothetical protein